MQVLMKEMVRWRFPIIHLNKVTNLSSQDKTWKTTVFLLFWPSIKIFQSCLPSKSVYLTFWPLALRREGSGENTQMNCCSPGSDCLICPPLVHGGVGVMINKGNTVLLPSILTMPPLAPPPPPPPSFRSASSRFLPMIQTPLSSLLHT